MKIHSTVLAAAFCIACVAPALAQPVISAKSGVIAHVQGTVHLGSEALEPSMTRFPDMKEQSVLRTEDGRAEVLLTPGVFLRLGEQGVVRMITNRLIDTRIELLSGSAVIEVDDLAKDTALTVVWKDATVGFDKTGLYRFDSEPARLRVFKGEAKVENGGSTVEVSGGKVWSYGATALQKFDTDDTDSLDNWSQRRSQYVALANISAAKYYRDNPNKWTLSQTSWIWNPFLGVYTLMPVNGRFRSPYDCRYMMRVYGDFGCYFWSPGTVTQVYYQPVAPQMPTAASYGYQTMAPTSSGYSGAVASAPVSSAAPAASSGSTAASSSSSSTVGHGSAGSGGRR
jgi:hypothetical protein